MYSTELRQWISQATHLTALIIDGQAFVLNQSCYQLLHCSENEPVTMRQVEAVYLFRECYEKGPKTLARLSPRDRPSLPGAQARLLGY